MILSPLNGMPRNGITSSKRPTTIIQKRMLTTVVIQVLMPVDRPRMAGGMISSCIASNGALKQPKNCATIMRPINTQTVGASG